MPDTELITDRDGLSSIRSDWDALATAVGEPQMSGSWIEAWWRHLAPAPAEPRIVVVREDGQLIGLAPFFFNPSERKRVDYRLPDVRIFGRLTPLALPGRELDVAHEMGRAFTKATPCPDILALEGLPLQSAWPRALRQSWPSRLRPTAHRYSTHACPTVSLQDGSFSDWLDRKSSNFRAQMRRLRRAFRDAGGSGRTSTVDTLDTDIDAFVRLHADRWQGRGDSNLVAFGDRLAPMLREAGDTLISTGRFRLRVLELDGRPISAQLFLRAGRRVMYVNGGWDERYAHLKPSMIGLLDAIEDAFERGDRILDLGLGEQPYKLRFADASDSVGWTVVMIPSRRLALTWARTAPMLATSAARNELKRRLSHEQLQRMRALRDRARK